VLVLSGDQLYRMDLRQLVQTHRDSQAGRDHCRLAGGAGAGERTWPIAHRRGWPDRSTSGKAAERWATCTMRMPPEWLESRGIAPRGREFLANMGIYLFRREALFELLNSQPLEMDFVLQIFPRCFPHAPFPDAICSTATGPPGHHPALLRGELGADGVLRRRSISNTSDVIYTRMRYLPASRLDAASLRRCLISDGCIVQEGARLEHCSWACAAGSAGMRPSATTVIIGADRYETDAEREENRRQGIPDFTVGDGSTNRAGRSSTRIAALAATCESSTNGSCRTQRVRIT